MRRTIQLMIACCCALSCAKETPTENNRLAPPSPHIDGSTRVIARGNVLDLEVIALLTNPSGERLQVVTGPTCPLFVSIFPDPTGEPRSTTTTSMACSEGTVVDLAHGDTVTLRRTIPADSLAAYGSGLFGVSVVVTTKTVITGAWVGLVRLPLTQ